MYLFDCDKWVTFTPVYEGRVNKYYKIPFSQKIHNINWHEKDQKNNFLW